MIDKPKYEVLEGALAEVEKGWCQGELEDARGAVCINGALVRALHGVGRVEDGPVDGFIGWQFGLDDLAIKKGTEAYESLPGVATAAFNDDHTKEEVIEFLKEAIRLAKAEAGVSIDLPAETPQEVPA